MNPAEQMHLRSGHDSASRYSSCRAFRLRFLTCAVVAGGAFAIAGTPARAESVYKQEHSIIVSLGAGIPTDNVVNLNFGSTTAGFPYHRTRFGFINGGNEPTGGLGVGFSKEGDGPPISWYNASPSSLAKFSAGDSIGPDLEASHPATPNSPDDRSGGVAAYYDSDNAHQMYPPGCEPFSLNPPVYLCPKKSNFEPGEQGYIAFSYLDDNLDTHYGYALVQVPTTSEAGQVARFLGYGYETTPNTAITVRAVPEIDPAAGASALSLVAGVLAMIEQRRRRAPLVA